MTFGKWLTVGIESGIFIYGLVGFHSIHDPQILAFSGLGMMIIGLFYAFFVGISNL